MNTFATSAARRAIAGTATVLAAMSGLAVGFAGTASADETASISGKIWFDRDYDGVQNNGEPGYQSGPEIILFQDGAQVGTYSTDADGHYVIDGLTPGTYRVANANYTGYYETTPNSQTVDLGAGGAAEANFGIRGGTIGGDAWFDADGDTARDADETAPEGAADANVHLFGPAGFELDTTLDADGHYLFQDLPNGRNYQVEAPALDGLSFLSGSMSDSQIDPTTGRSAELEIWQGSGQVVNAGYSTAVAPAADVDLGTVGIDPEKETYPLLDTFTMTVPVVNNGDVADMAYLNVAYPTVLSVRETGGDMAATDGAGNVSAQTSAPLAPGESATLTVTFRTESAMPNAEILVSVNGELSPAEDADAVSRTVDIGPAAVQPVANDSALSGMGAKGTKNDDLAYTGASTLLPLLAGGVLLAAGGTVLFLVRRRRGTI